MKIYYFSGTHWDREWYQSFQGFRMRLVDLMDKLIEGLETNQEYGVWHFDGQTIVFDDYFEIRPENRERVKALIQSGKCIAGPWYCMPDELSLSGESLIKNLQKGYAKARDLGAEPMRYGYICDIFGHIAQMPQIFRKMGINHALLGRGLNDGDTPMHFSWEAPDGSKVTTFKVNDDDGYTAFAFEVLGYGAELTDEELEQRIKTHIDKEIARANAPVLLLMDAADHRPYDGKVPKYLKIIKKLYPEAEVIHNHIENFCRDIDEYAETLPSEQGELLHTARSGTSYNCLLLGCLSSRYPLKKENDKLQSLLEKVIAPMYAAGFIQKPLSFLDLANQYLLQNHPHDSICGCSIDQVHQDMLYRYDQAKEICAGLLKSFRDSYPKGDGEALYVQVYNPLPYWQERVIDLKIDFPVDYPYKWGAVNSFKIQDEEGNELPYTISDYLENVISFWGPSDKYTVTVKAKLAPMSLNAFKIVPFERCPRCLGKMQYDRYSAENAYISLTIHDNGTINITDKQTNRTYQNLLQPVDNGEIGGGYRHSAPLFDQVITGGTAQVAIMENGENRVTFRITQTLSLPACIAGHGRSNETKELKLIHDVSLEKDARYVKVHTIVDNTILDHRLRLLLPTGIEGKTYYANQPFCFVQRETGLDSSTQEWKEPDALEKPTSGIVYKKDSKGGLAFISQYGIHECGVEENGDMFITLFRAFSQTVQTNGQPGPQLQQSLEFSYLLQPTDTEITFAALQKQQDMLQTELPMVTCGVTAPSKPLLEVSGDNIVYSTLTPAHDALELRLYNLSDTAQQATVTFGAAVKDLKLVDLDGQEVSALTLENQSVSFPVGKWEFMTLSFQKEE